MSGSKEFAVLQAQVILCEILADDRTWTCRHCGFAENGLSTEICGNCVVEDLGQGDPVAEAAMIDELLKGATA
jgi:hypothetical protein